MFRHDIDALLQHWSDHHVHVPEQGGRHVPQNELVEHLPAVHKKLVLGVLVRVGVDPKGASGKEKGLTSRVTALLLCKTDLAMTSRAIF